MKSLVFQREKTLSPEEFIDILQRSGLAERRPIEDKGRIKKMCQNANLIVTASNKEGKIIGIARAISDFAYCTYLSDLAVDKAFQKKGIGKHLVHLIKQEAPEAKLILLSAPAAVNYYPKIGLAKHQDCFIL